MRDRSRDWRQDDQGFRDWARLGYAWQQPVADALAKAGLDVDMPPLELRERFQDAWQYRNQADITAAGRRIEVKSMAVKFWGPDTWPYPEVRLDPIQKWRAKNPKPWAYVFVSRKTGIMLACPGNDTSRLGRCYSLADQERGTKDTWATMPVQSLVTLRVMIGILCRGESWW